MVGNEGDAPGMTRLSLRARIIRADMPIVMRRAILPEAKAALARIGAFMHDRW